ncbi:MAG: DUF1552 domain-containing protein [Polyangiales bacterium]
MDRAREIRRRLFLKAVAAGVAAPLAAAVARRALAAPGARPGRLMVMYFPDGVPPEHYTPLGSGDQFDLAVGEAVLEPLAPYQRYLNVLLGLQIGAGEENHEAISQLLLPAREQGRSVEQVVARGLDSPALLLGAVPLKSAGEQFNAGAKNVMFRDGDWLRPQVDPVRAADTLFGATAGGATAAPSGEARFRQQALALTESELETLHGELHRLTGEQTKLAVHLEALRQLRASSARPPPPMASGQCTPTLPAVDALRGQVSDYFYTESHLPEIYPAQLQVAAQALACGSARVVGLQVSYGVSEQVWSFLPGFLASDQFHGTLSHGDGSKPDIRARFAKAKRWLIQGIVDHVLPTLDQPDPLDPAHSVLDNTLIYVCSELADGAMHNTNTKPMYIDNGKTMIDTQLPIITVGGGAGALQTGKLWTFNNRPHTDLLLTLCELMGVPGSEFGPFRAIDELKT